MAATLCRMGRKPIAPDTSTFRGRFAAGLREQRQRRFGTLDEFVAALQANGITATKATVSGWETGYRVPSIELWPGIATTLKVPVRSLLPKE
jgi:transcriptional regulator with XRE-family HTH domain